MTHSPDAAPQIHTDDDGIPLFVNGRRLSDVERQALREAQARREAEAAADLPAELGGGDRTVEPTRYGDWEKNGRAVDFS